MTLSIKAMTYFTTALRHGNIAKAAQELNIAASAVSSAIDQVEMSFDLKLINRQRSRGIVANANGRQIAQKLEGLLEEYRAVLAEGADLKRSHSGTLRIGYYAPIAPAFLPTILAGALSNPHDVTLFLEECDNDAAQDGLMNGRYDLILFVAEGARASVEYDVLLAAPAYCLASAKHPFARRKSISIAEIVREKLIVLNRPVASAYYHELFEVHEAKPQIVAHANSTEMVRSLVGAGQGCAVLNMRPLSHETYGGDKVAAIPISDPIAPLTLAVAYDKSRPREMVKTIIDCAVEYFSDPAAVVAPLDS